VCVCVSVSGCAGLTLDVGSVESSAPEEVDEVIDQGLELADETEWEVASSQPEPDPIEMEQLILRIENGYIPSATSWKQGLHSVPAALSSGFKVWLHLRDYYLGFCWDWVP